MLLKSIFIDLCFLWSAGVIIFICQLRQLKIMFAYSLVTVYPLLSQHLWSFRTSTLHLKSCSLYIYLFCFDAFLHHAVPLLDMLACEVEHFVECWGSQWKTNLYSIMCHKQIRELIVSAESNLGCSDHLTVTGLWNYKSKWVINSLHYSLLQMLLVY